MPESSHFQRKAQELVSLCGGDVDYAYDILSAVLRAEISRCVKDKSLRLWIYKNTPTKTEAAFVRDCLNGM